MVKADDLGERQKGTLSGIHCGVQNVQSLVEMWGKHKANRIVPLQSQQQGIDQPCKVLAISSQSKVSPTAMSQQTGEVGAFWPALISISNRRHVACVLRRRSRRAEKLRFVGMDAGFGGIHEHDLAADIMMQVSKIQVNPQLTCTSNNQKAAFLAPKRMLKGTSGSTGSMSVSLLLLRSALLIAAKASRLSSLCWNLAVS